MHSTQTASLKGLLAELDADSEHPPSNGGYEQKQERPDRYSGEEFHLRSDEPLESDKSFRSDKPPMSKRMARRAALFLFAVLVGVAGTLASQSYRDEIVKVFPPFAWLSPVSTMTAPVPSVTIADLQGGLKPLAVDLALVRRSVVVSARTEVGESDDGLVVDEHEYGRGRRERVVRARPRECPLVDRE